MSIVCILLNNVFFQCLESAGPKSTADAVDPRRRVDERALDKEEEDYFNEDRFISGC